MDTCLKWQNRVCPTLLQQQAKDENSQEEGSDEPDSHLVKEGVFVSVSHPEFSEKQSQ